MAVTGHSGSAARMTTVSSTPNSSASALSGSGSALSTGSAEVVSLDAYRVEEPPTIYNFARSSGVYDRAGKRILDIFVSSVMLILLAPLLASLALGVRLTMGSKVLFFQDRVGRNGKPFRMIKFRSMRHDRRSSDELDEWEGTDRRLTHKTTADPRHTAIGRFIRKWSLDELPQLWNVLRGDMSLVGPRPELVQVAKRFELTDHARHLARPGITGLWQVSESRGQLLHENVHIDLDYVRAITLRSDLKILFRTFGSVVKVRGS